MESRGVLRGILAGRLAACGPSRGIHVVAALRPAPPSDASRFHSSQVVAPAAGSSISDVAIVGGGAAGLAAAYFAAAADPGSRVAVLERTSEPGKKILMSGGARCNVMPTGLDVDRDFVTDGSASALRRVFASWDMGSCREWLEGRVGLRLAEEAETGKVFPASNSAREVRDALVGACRRGGVDFIPGASVEGLEAEENGGWACRIADGRVHLANAVVMATGGKSFPAVGTDGTGYEILERLGHVLVEPYPALTPLEGPHPGGARLPGASLYAVEASVRVGKGKKKLKRAARSGFLFTHRGYSGPSVLDLSHRVVRQIGEGEKERGRFAAKQGEFVTKQRKDATQGEGEGGELAVVVNWTGAGRGEWEVKLGAGGKGGVLGVLQEGGLPKRLAEALMAECGVPADRRMAEVRKGEVRALVEALCEYRLRCEGHGGYRKAEVTGGGVPLDQVDCGTMESRVAPGVYLCGELLDVFGRIGGFNFYWAWVSGRLAGMSAGQKGSRVSKVGMESSLGKGTLLHRSGNDQGEC